jgi:hypothetical protein
VGIFYDENQEALMKIYEVEDLGPKCKIWQSAKRPRFSVLTGLQGAGPSAISAHA